MSRQRKFLTIEKKKEIIACYEKGVRIKDLATKFDISSSSVATILQNKERIKGASVATGVKTLVSQHQRNSLVEEMEKLLLIWIHERQKAGDTVTPKMICNEAIIIYENLRTSAPGTSTKEPGEEFKGSRGWFEKFKKRSGIHGVIREGANGYKEEAEKFSREFQDWITVNEYKPEQVFNCDETSLFWKKMPKRTFITKVQECMPGPKPFNDRISLLFCANADGSLKIKPMLVYHSETPRIFKKKKVKKPFLGVYWKSNKKALVTRTIFTDWIMEEFGPTVKKFLKEKNLPEKAVLIMDHAPGHPPELEMDLADKFSFIKIKFLPVNTTAILQPMDQQVISNFKKLYVKHMFQKCFHATLLNGMTLMKFWKDYYHILSAIQVITTAWNEVTVTTLNAAWKKLWPNCCSKRISKFSAQEATENDILDKIISLGKALDLGVNEEDIEELINEQSSDFSIQDLKQMEKEITEEKEEESTTSEEEEWERESSKKEKIPMSDLNKILNLWEDIQFLITKWHPNKAEINKLCAAVEDKCLYHFRKILEEKNN